jgi:phosphoribosyl 1,2-cyclic phosphodiesterase
MVVLDAGTGLRGLGRALLEGGDVPPIHMLLSHTHWDHILGLPFFAPLWMKETELYVYPLASDAQERFQRTIFDDIHFPVSANDVPAKVEFRKPDGLEWTIGSARVRRIPLNHPGGAQGFRIDDDDGTSLSYLTDNELNSPGAVVSADELARFADGVGVLIHDSQYVAADMPNKRGWGHSVVDDVLRLGVLAEVGILALFHHDPDRTDLELDNIAERGANWVKEHTQQTRLVVAQEGLTLDLKRR